MVCCVLSVDDNENQCDGRNALWMSRWGRGRCGSNDDLPTARAIQVMHSSPNMARPFVCCDGKATLLFISAKQALLQNIGAILGALRSVISCAANTRPTCQPKMITRISSKSSLQLVIDNLTSTTSANVKQQQNQIMLAAKLATPQTKANDCGSFF